MKEAKEIDRLRKLLRAAAEHIRHPDYEWTVAFERKVWAAIEDETGLCDGSGVVVQHANSSR